MIVDRGACPLCGRASLMEVDPDDWPFVRAWMAGRGKIQQVLPHWTADQREQLLNGSHGECFDKAFGPMAEEEDGED